ncbi:Transcriptional regulatory protein pro-1 [Fusarium austroafricanum]|uniref:Transcriptional regulatory protein pro-1 n=1 Tax=Fusarium austroafricanum TaxID=2364996 RepID=A0A8H4P047_9HYPO|nr:Transcriptional regulatory protein pro-1 [Fusarium austroafricanum]
MAEAEAAVKTRLTRTRTGCFKCRVRRRKCDEGKPSCQRCLDGGFECQYGTKLSFLQKNAKTSSESYNAKYAKLRKFVVPETATKPDIQVQHYEVTSSKQKKSVRTDTSQNHEESQQIQSSRPPPQVQPQLPPPAIINLSLETNAASSQALATHLQGPSSFNLAISPSNAAYETAIDGLLTVGHDHYTARHDGFPNCLHMHQDRAVELLDINDADQTFGLIVPRVAMNSMPLLSSLLSLSLATLGNDTHLDLTGQSLLPDPDNPHIGIMRSALTFTFTTLHRQFVTQPTSWLSPSKNIGYDSINSVSFQDHYPSVALAISWMILRLGVSVSLMNGSPVSIPSMVSYEASSPLNGIYRESLKCGREPVLLCAQVLNYCFGDDASTSPERIRTPAAQKWKALYGALHMWYTNRPRDFKPMLEIEDNELFPLILFTNGAAILANQLYHSSMLLLLQNRPRTLPKEHGRNVYLSPLWHAQHICGISLNNDTRNSWDFTLLASFYLAAKRMTYEPQQHAILHGIGRIGSLTGWNVNTLSAQLVHEWQPDGGY